MRFSKWHALGNAYLVVERDDAGALSRARVRGLCDPGTGVGADGVIEVTAATATDVSIVIWNADGSVAKMSGNGTRIAAAWLAARTDAAELSVLTAGRTVRTAIGPDGLIEQHLEVTVGELESLDVAGDPVELVAVDVGNPHAVIPVAETSQEELARLGPLIEIHPRFPKRTNVQLAAATGRHDVRARVWERGGGETASSGSSAVAVAAVAIALGWCDSPVTVRFPGGTLHVALDAHGSGARLVGPAVEICRGAIVSWGTHPETGATTA